MITFRVKSTTDTQKLAGAIAYNIKNCDYLELTCLGAQCINIAVKASAVARGFVSPQGIDFHIKPCFNMVDVGGQERTIIKLLLEKERIN